MKHNNTPKHCDWQPIVPSHVGSSFIKGYLYGTYIVGFAILFLAVTGILTLDERVAPFLKFANTNLVPNPSLITSFMILLFSILAFVVCTSTLIVVHEILHIICFPKFWRKDVIKVHLTVSNGISVHSNQELSKKRAILVFIFPFITLSVILLLCSLLVQNEAIALLFKLVAVANFIMSSFDLRAAFYLLRLPHNVIVRGGGYRFPK